MGRRLEYTDNPRTTAVDRRSTPSVEADRQTRTSADVSVPRLAGFSLIPDPPKLKKKKNSRQTLSHITHLILLPNLYRAPKRRVRDGAGPLRALSRGRSCADACRSMLVRRRCSSAPASALSCTVHLSRLQHGLHNLPHSNKHVDVLELMLECSRLDGRLPSGLSAWPAPLASDGTSSRVARA